MNQAALTYVMQARTTLLLDNMYFGRLAMHLQLVERPGIQTLAVDGRSMYYNPDYVMSLPKKVMVAAVAHEVEHCAMGHISRRGGRAPGRWNSACDYVVNSELKECGFLLGEGWYYDPKYKGMAAEQIYEMLPENHGSGQDEIFDEAINAEATEIEQTWLVAVAQAAYAARGQGDLPGSAKRILEQMKEPKVDWREVLRDFFGAVNPNDYSFSRPNKKFMSMGVYLPTLHGESIGNVDVVIDTSGSITGKVLAAFASEIVEIFDTARPQRLRVIYCDAAVNHVDVFEQGDTPVFEMHGGGGTDFRPPFKMIADEGEKPDAFVYLTDMYGAFPDADPGFPVLWCATTKVIGPFGQTLHVDI